MGTKTRLGLVGVAVIVLALGLGLFWPKVREQHQAVKGSQCQGNLKQLALAMEYYYKRHGHFPPAYTVGPDGKPWHSWRVLLLPYIDQDQLYSEYRFNEPWDGPNNSKLLSRVPKCYTCPSDPESLGKSRTNYFTVVGSETAFPGSASTKFAEITRPRGSTILLVEAVRQDIEWMEPRDLSFDHMSFQLNDPNMTSISSMHHVPHVVMTDGTREQISGISTLELRTMFLIREPSK